MMICTTNISKIITDNSNLKHQQIDIKEEGQSSLAERRIKI